MIYAGVAFVFIAAFAGYVLLLHKLQAATKARAEAETKNEQSEKVLDEVGESNAARDRLRSDRDYADKLRDKYQRD